MKKLFILLLPLLALAGWRGEFDDEVYPAKTSSGASATGGDITVSGGYKIHTFTNSGTFTVSGGSLLCDVLVVAGGGGGGSYRPSGTPAGFGGQGGGGGGSTGGGTNGVVNTGGGGGGGERDSPATGGAGGSGIVIVRYPNE